MFALTRNVWVFLGFLPLSNRVSAYGHYYCFSSVLALADARVVCDLDRTVPLCRAARCSRAEEA